MRKSPGQSGSICRACILGAEILAGRPGLRGRLALFVLIGLLSIPTPRALSEDSPIRYGPASKSLQRWASNGYRMDRLDKTEEKLTFRTYIFAISRDFKPEDATGLIRLVYDPLEVGVSRVWDSGKEKG
jgi:hypothetical protein